jgi:rod shape-determining protein MreC
VRVRPFTDFSRLEFVRVVDYGTTGQVSAGPANPVTPSAPATAAAPVAPPSSPKGGH